MKKLTKIVIYGDSISTRAFGNGGYEGYLEEAFCAETVNYAISGSGLSSVTPENTITILQNPSHIHEDADVILMWHGTNDWYWGSPLGSPDDEQPGTFYGAIRTAVRCIRQKAPNAVLVWITPIFRLQQPYEMPEEGMAYETKNRVGHTMEAYYNAIIQSSVRYGFPVIDMRRSLNIHENNHRQYLEDQVHPNQAGYEKISRVIKKGLDEILCLEGYTL